MYQSYATITFNKFILHYMQPYIDLNNPSSASEISFYSKSALSAFIEVVTKCAKSVIIGLYSRKRFNPLDLDWILNLRENCVKSEWKINGSGRGTFKTPFGDGRGLELGQGLTFKTPFGYG